MTLRDVFVAGEQLRVTPQLTALFTHVPAVLHNHYGPTEAHVVTALTLTGPVTGWPALPPVGRPIDDVRIYLLDALGTPVPAGVPGEVHVAGPCLARGYLNRPELTEASFVHDPFHGAPGERVYRTGDLARFRADGEIEYLGRIDRQVKVRGFRVEPGEIENRVMAHPSVREAVVDLHGTDGAEQQLIAWVVPQPGATVDAGTCAGTAGAPCPST
ncbi:AMP-binding protein [Kitasatospora sp. NPDC092286]|uniref:AMP-binding protein n=1 Tax=Kitasatospora sp. NPDC092286 TaxID=3364087 RepID=UPI0038053013